ncbi:MAG: beta-ketoacyl-[acyl-carrier-protein] synthase family protein [Gammaproteobacteria bacterium]|nr:beta-ketoacyl-[acyl-carrier-protein] synthase family protein [Gammaproteobacteria bacterium]
MRKVAITGLGVVSPLGIGKEKFWQALMEKRSVAKHLSQVQSSTLFGSFEFSSQVIVEVEDFDALALGLPPEVCAQDRFIQFAVAAAQQAVDDAGLEPGQYNADRMGIALSTAICGTRQMEQEFVKVTNYGQERIDPALVGPGLYLASMSNTPSMMLAGMLDLQGPCVTLSTGCIGGLDAIGYAFEAIKYGDADVMITGATEAPITPITLAAFDIIHCMSSRHNSRPQSASRPYDKQRDGFVLSEGCGIFILEELEHARRRGAPIYAEITGFANTSNAIHMTDLLSDGDDLARAMSVALGQSHIDPSHVNHVSSHGSSTPQNDSCETSALKRVLGDQAYRIPVNSAKSMLGHALAAASAMEIAICALSFKHCRVPPTANYSEADPACDLDYVAEGPRNWNGDVILKDASGFSGLHAGMVLRRTESGVHTDQGV